MKRPSQIKNRPTAGPVSGFTIPEVMIVMVIFSFVVAAMVATQLFGLRTYTLAATKLTATAGARKTLNAMRDKIRAASVVLVGTYDPSSGSGFSQIPDGQPQVGNALAIQFTNDVSTNIFIYYKDPSNPTNVICSMDNGVVNVLAEYVTNYYCFEAEDYQGNILTNYQNNPVIHIILQFYQWEYPIAIVGHNGLNAYNYYQLRTRVTRRAK